MPMVVSNGQRIFFRVEGERGAFLMLHHGLFGSHEDWYRAGYVEELAKEFRLVVPDARGHGRSDRPVGADAYGPGVFAEDLLEIMNSLGIRNLHFLGYGMGAPIGLEMLRRYPERVRIAVLGGEAPLMLPSVRDHWRAMADTLGNGTLGALLEGLRARDHLVRWEAADPPEEDRDTATALLQALSCWDLHGEERISVTSPVTLFAGSEDPAADRVEKARALINRARLVIFPGLSHAKLFAQRTSIVEELVRLLKSGRREDADANTSGVGRTQRSGEQRSERADAGRPDGKADRRGRDRGFQRREGSKQGSQSGLGPAEGEQNEATRPLEAQGAPVSPAPRDAPADLTPQAAMGGQPVNPSSLQTEENPPAPRGREAEHSEGRATIEEEPPG